MKGYFERRRINKTINKVNKLKKECANRHIYEVRMPLERISTSLSNSLVKYTHKKYKMVNECLKRISSHLSNDHSTLLKNECLKANSVISGTYVAPSRGEQLIIEDEEKVNELEKKLRYVDNRMTEVSKQMDACLGKDKIAWKKLNREKNFLVGQLRVINQAFDSMLIHTNNLKTAETLKGLRSRYSGLIANQQPLVDTEEFNDNCEMIQYVHDEAQRQDQAMSEKLFSSSAISDDEDMYYLCLEEKLANEKNLKEHKEEPGMVSSSLETSKV